VARARKGSSASRCNMVVPIEDHRAKAGNILAAASIVDDHRRGN
jgi:hypothetical protein